MKRKAFTLIELLVVISIIALLLSVLLPALSKVKVKAKDLICRTNLKNIQLATILYTNNYEGKMPEYQLGKGLWINKISVYLEDVDKARYCPSTKINKTFDTANLWAWGSARQSWVWNWGTTEPEHGSYTINWFFYTFDPPKTNTRYFHSMADVRAPHRTPIFADSLWVDAAPSDTDTCPADLNLDGDPNYGGSMSRILINRHGSHINVGFVDGHQQVVELGALWSLKWYNDFKTTAWMTRDDGTPIYRK